MPGDAFHSTVATVGIILFIVSALEEINDTCSSSWAGVCMSVCLHAKYLLILPPDLAVSM